MFLATLDNLKSSKPLQNYIKFTTRHKLIKILSTFIFNTVILHFFLLFILKSCYQNMVLACACLNTGWNTSVSWRWRKHWKVSEKFPKRKFWWGVWFFQITTFLRYAQFFRLWQLLKGIQLWLNYYPIGQKSNYYFFNWILTIKMLFLEWFPSRGRGALWPLTGCR